MPKLRFPEFKNDWEHRKIGEFIHERSECANSNLPLYSLTIERGVVPKSERYERSFLVKTTDDAYKVMKSGDFAYNPMNLRFGALAKYKGTADVAVSKYYNIFYINKNSVSDYLEPYLTSYKMIQYYNKMATGTLEEKKRVHYLDFIHFKKLFPSLPEQQKIAAFLSAVDKKIQQLTRKKELLEQYKKGVMQKLFSQEIRFKPALSEVEGAENGNDYPDWEEKRLGEVGDINGGGTPDTSNPQYWDGNIQWFTPTEIVDKYIGKSKRTISKSGLQNSSAKFLPVGTILFTSRATIASLSFALETCTTNQGFQSIIVANKYHSEFIYYWISKNKKAFIRKAQGSTFLEISNNEMKKIKVRLPCFDEQKRIGDFLKSLDVKIEAVQSQLSQTQQFKKGLLQQMFV